MICGGGSVDLSKMAPLSRLKGHGLWGGGGLVSMRTLLSKSLKKLANFSLYWKGHGLWGAHVSALVARGHGLWGLLL
jgi:hypothetical protein